MADLEIGLSPSNPQASALCVIQCCLPHLGALGESLIFLTSWCIYFPKHQCDQL